MEFTLTTGKQVFPHSSAKIYPLVYQQGAGKTSWPKGTYEENYAARSVQPAAIDGDSRSGMWYTSRYGLVEGSILGVFMTTTVNSRPYGSVAYVLRLRKEAPLIAINFTPPAAGEASMPVVQVFMGNADVLTVDEVQEMIDSRDYPIAGNFVSRWMDPEELGEDTEVRVLTKGKPRPKRESLEVLDRRTRKRIKVEVPATPTRRIRIRR